MALASSATQQQFSLCASPGRRSSVALPQRRPLPPPHRHPWRQHSQHNSPQQPVPPCRGRRAPPPILAAAATSGSSSSGSARLQPPYRVVITGSTKGVGRSLAEAFVRAGDSVVITSRDAGRVGAAVSELSELAQQLGSGAQAVGVTTNVARPAEVAALADFARDTLGGVDVWINNAGTNAYSFRLLAQQSESDIVDVVETNVLGVLLGCREAIRLMRDQEGGGHIFNMDGAGADGGATPRFAAYGATKRSLAQLGKSLNAELRMLKLNSIAVHNLSPGMVVTELLMAGADTKVARFFINCLAEKPDTVAEYLVPRIRRVPQESRSLLPGGGVGSSQYIRYLTGPKAYSQILGRLLGGARRNRFVEE